MIFAVLAPQRHLPAGALIAVAVLIAVSASAFASSPLKITNCNTAVSRPKLLTLSCGDGNTVLKGLSWSSFGGSTARAKGTFLMNTCEPNCAAGKDVSFKVNVKAVNTLIAKGKTKRFKGLPGRRSDVKKAIVTLAAGQSIDVTTGI